MRSFPLLFLLFAAGLVSLFPACSSDELAEQNLADVTIWSGPSITVEKLDGADPTDAANQDRISDNVWITRGNMGGQIYNAVIEATANQDISPDGTLWAVGRTTNLAGLNFVPFRSAVNPRDVVGVDLVLLLEEERIALDITFTSWSRNQGGGFAYERATP
ncbi:MAG: hypothetical protein AAF828_03280 [Bacteroidota bacterium]